MDGVQPPSSAHFKRLIMCISVYLPSNVLQNDLFFLFFIFFKWRAVIQTQIVGLSAFKGLTLSSIRGGRGRALTKQTASWYTLSSKNQWRTLMTLQAND